MRPSSVRSAGLDLVRAVAIAAIVIGHVATSPQVERAVFTWHVPVFFVLTGYLWSDHRALAAEVRSRWKSLARPYLAWLALIGCIAVPLAFMRGGLRHAGGQIARMVVGGSYLTTPFTAFWFFSCLFAAAVVFRALVLVRVPWWGTALAAILLTPLGPILAKAPLSLGTAVPALLFIAAGRGLRDLPDRFRRWPLGVTFLAVGIAAVASGVDVPLDMKVGNFGRPVVGVAVAGLISAGLILTLGSFSAGIARVVPWLSAAVARFGPAVILAHGLPLDLTRGVTSVMPRLGLVILGTALVVAAAARTPWASLLLGPRLPDGAAGRSETWGPDPAGAPRGADSTG